MSGLYPRVRLRQTREDVRQNIAHELEGVGSSGILSVSLDGYAHDSEEGAPCCR